MRNIPISRYIYLGFHIRYLLDCKPGFPVMGDKYILKNIEVVLEYIESLNLNVTKNTNAKLELDKILDEFKNKESDYVLNEDDVERIYGIIDDLRKTLDAETRGIYVYTVVEKRFETDKLLNNVHLLFSPNVFSNIPDIAKYDFSESGKCIAFELPTSSAFHILRGTESVLRVLYFSVKIRNRISILNWGLIINDLKNCRVRKPPDHLIDNFDIIRNNYRNPTQHPETIYNIEQAQDLFSMCVGVINNTITFLLNNNIDIKFY